PRVRGRGIARLRRAGVAVEKGVLGAEARAMNEDFEKLITTGEPFVVLKLAVTLDGRIATRTGDSRWVTSAAARRRVHDLRNRLDAVIVGSGTVLADDPELTCRIRGGRNPLRVVLDGRLRTPLSARLFDGEAPTRVYTQVPDGAKARRLRARGIEVRRGGRERPGALGEALRDLARDGVKSVLLEGGAGLAARALADGVVDRLIVFLAPKVVGGDGVPAIGGLGIRRMNESLPFEILRVEALAPDLAVELRPAFPQRSQRVRIRSGRA
ncbi:MAG: bifunctional diaminohydroxyphosphoribosylaminopyrimidine deaminase/5-amino-6-(5-phosphoribosylamino)uracil reductase RibD, partial [Candidatus Binatia bacterium]